MFLRATFFHSNCANFTPEEGNIFIYIYIFFFLKIKKNYSENSKMIQSISIWMTMAKFHPFSFSPIGERLNLTPKWDLQTLWQQPHQNLLPHLSIPTKSNQVEEHKVYFYQWVPPSSSIRARTHTFVICH